MTCLDPLFCFPNDHKEGINLPHLPINKSVYWKILLFEGHHPNSNAFLIDLNILDWNFQNLVAIALGSSVYIWNGENHNEIENIDLSLTCNYISSVSWIKEGSCLAVGTSEGEVQVWNSFFHFHNMLCVIAR